MGKAQLIGPVILLGKGESDPNRGMALAIISFVLIAAMTGSCLCAPTTSNALGDVVGHKLLVDYGENRFVHTYYTENRMKWESIAGKEKSLSEEEAYERLRIADDVYLISWQEKNGTVVAIIMNLDRMEANAVVAFPEKGTNKIWRLRGKITVLE